MTKKSKTKSEESKGGNFMLGCTPYAEEEVHVVMNNPEDYAEWLAEFGGEEE